MRRLKLSEIWSHLIKRRVGGRGFGVALEGFGLNNNNIYNISFELNQARLLNGRQTPSC